MAPELGKFINDLLDKAAQKQFPKGNMPNAEVLVEKEEAFFDALVETGLSSVWLDPEEISGIAQLESDNPIKKGRWSDRRIKMLAAVFGLETTGSVVRTNTEVVDLFFPDEAAISDSCRRQLTNNVAVAKNQMFRKAEVVASGLDKVNPTSVSVRDIFQKMANSQKGTARGRQYRDLYWVIAERFGDLGLSDLQTLAFPSKVKK